MKIDLYSDDPEFHKLIAHELFEAVSARYRIPYLVLASKKRSRGAVACRDVAYQTAVSMFLLDIKQTGLAFGVSPATILSSTTRSLFNWDLSASSNVLAEVFKVVAQKLKSMESS
jgi:chromosomal replication initiation ATPase DnaA